MGTTKTYGLGGGVAGTSEIEDNVAVAAKVISEDSREYLRVITTDSGERVVLGEGTGTAGEGIPVVIGPGDAGANEFTVGNGSGQEIEFDIGGTNVIKSQAATNFKIGTHAAHTLELMTADTARLHIAANGKVFTTGAIATALNGTFTATNGSTAISSGSSTAFSTELHIGSAIKIGSEGTYTVVAIASDTALTLDSTFTGSTGAGKSGTTDGGELFAVQTGDGKTIFGVNSTGAVGLGTAPGTLPKSNLAIGDASAFDNATREAEKNTFIGQTENAHALTGGHSNTLLGFSAGENTANGDRNTSVGCHSGGMTNSTDATYVGYRAGQNCTGSKNAVVGSAALDESSTAANASAVGYGSLGLCTGNNNTALGHEAGNAITSGAQNVSIGSGSDCAATLDNQIAIGYGAVCDAASKAVIGDASNPATLDFSGSGNSWSTTSDERIKENIQGSSLGLSFINALRPITHTAKNPADWPDEIKPSIFSERTESRKDDDGNDVNVIIPPASRPDTVAAIKDGLLAQEVKAVMDAQGVEFSGWTEQANGLQRLQYERLVLPLIKAVQELTARIEELENGD